MQASNACMLMQKEHVMNDRQTTSKLRFRQYFAGSMVAATAFFLIPWQEASAPILEIPEFIGTPIAFSTPIPVVPTIQPTPEPAATLPPTELPTLAPTEPPTPAVASPPQPADQPTPDTSITLKAPPLAPERTRQEAPRERYEEQAPQQVEVSIEPLRAPALNLDSKIRPATASETRRYAPQAQPVTITAPSRRPGPARIPSRPQINTSRGIRAEADAPKLVGIPAAPTKGVPSRAQGTDTLEIGGYTVQSVDSISTANSGGAEAAAYLRALTSLGRLELRQDDRLCAQCGPGCESVRLGEPIVITFEDGLVLLVTLQGDRASIFYALQQGASFEGLRKSTLAERALEALSECA